MSDHAAFVTILMAITNGNQVAVGLFTGQRLISYGALDDPVVLMAIISGNPLPDILFTGQGLSYGALDHLIDFAATRLVAYGIHHGEVIAVGPFPNALEGVIMTLAVIRCRAVAALLLNGNTYLQGEWENFFSQSGARRLLTGCGGDTPAAQTGATRLGLPILIALVDVPSGIVEITNSPILLRGSTGPSIAEVVNRPGDIALQLNASGAGMNPLSEARLITRWAGNETRRAGRRGDVVGSTAPGRSDDTSTLPWKDIVSFTTAATVALCAALLNKQGPEASKMIGGAPLLLLYGAVITAFVGKLGHFQGFLKTASVMLFLCGVAVLVVCLLPPGYSHIALVITLEAAGWSIILGHSSPRA